MASRTNTSVGMAVTVTIMGVLLIATFILSIVFYGQKQRLERELLQAQDARGQFIRSDEINDDSILRLVNQKPSNVSLVGYLRQSLEQTMDRVTGNRQQTFEGLSERLAQIDGSDTMPLLRVVADRESRIDRLNRSLADANRARTNAESDLQAEVDRLARIQSEYNSTVSALNDEIGRYSSELERYRGMVNATISENNSRVDDIRNSAAELESGLRGRLSELQEQVTIQQSVIEELRQERAGEVLRPTEEYALVDARVVSTDGARRQAIIDIGRNNRVILGMTFEVYSDASAIRPDRDGNYPRGKATLEVIRIENDSTVCRVIRETQGNPVVTGDVVANAVFDPNKRYSFVVFGNFDSNNDGVATPQGRNAIAGLINDWGGDVLSELDGHVDFLVLGQRPILPPQPPSDAPMAVVLEYRRLLLESQEYDRLFQTATQTGIPILNQNRLFTLTGYHARR
ncbi:MAG: hypothetical protein EA376_03005 [Phycisphaeraceae bacterium]|nr:MAG: hypothetical protein EA376_03005 [Phycisphaeraceae bacterium]